MQSLTLMNHIIKPALSHMESSCKGIDTPAARQLMLAVAAQESHCGRYFKQIGGPAQGVWQVEPDTEQDIYSNYLEYRPDIKDKLQQLLPPIEVGDVLITNPMYCCAVARLVFYRQKDPLPRINDVEDMWNMYKSLYNTHKGKATREEFFMNWAKFVRNVPV